LKHGLRYTKKYHHHRYKKDIGAQEVREQGQSFFFLKDKVGDELVLVGKD